MDMTVLHFDDVWKEYGRGSSRCRALNGLTFSVREGERVALVGASGSGKTTALNLAAGLDRPTRGTVTLFGRNLASMSDVSLAGVRRERVGIVFQALNLLPALTARENVELALALAGTPAAERRRRAHELLDLAGVSHRENARPDALSHGESQRVALLRAVAHAPDVLFMDEPTSALDTTHVTELMDLVLLLNVRQQMTILATTHDPRVLGYFTRTLTLVDGRVAAEDARHA